MSNAFMNELPPYYEDIREFQELTETVVVDWDKLDEALFSLEGVEDDQFILTSSEAAIAVREKDFGIVADPKKESLKFRKLRILARMQENAPYVFEYLIKVLDSLVGENNHQIILDINLFEMEVAIDAEQATYYEEIIKLVERIVPLNIDLLTTILALKEYLELINGAYTWSIKAPITSRFKTGSKPATVGKEIIGIKDEIYAFETNARVCGRFRAGGAL